MTDRPATERMRVLAATLVVAVVMSGALTGCGFQPLYQAQGGAKQSASVRQMAAIEIPPIQDRIGQVLRNALRDRLIPKGVARQSSHRLDVSVQENRADIAILRDATSTFSKMTVEANWALVDKRTDAPVLRGTTRRVTSFPIPVSEFAALEAEKDARDRAISEIADDIHLRLGLYFERGS